MEGERKTSLVSRSVSDSHHHQPETANFEHKCPPTHIFHCTSVNKCGINLAAFFVMGRSFCRLTTGSSKHPCLIVHLPLVVTQFWIPWMLGVVLVDGAAWQVSHGFKFSPYLNLCTQICTRILPNTSSP